MRLLVIMACCCVVTCGCGSHELKTATVSGTVSYDGKLLTKGVVTFTPDRARGATGAIQADGSFTLSTYGQGDGAVIGTHRIAVMCIEKMAERPKAEAGLDDKIFAAGRHRSLIPVHYGDYNTSGFSFEVKSGQHNVANLKLTQSVGTIDSEGL